MIKGIPSAESSHTLWGLGKGFSRQPYPCPFLQRGWLEPRTSGHKWRDSTTAPRPPFQCDIQLPWQKITCGLVYNSCSIQTSLLVPFIWKPLLVVLRGQIHPTALLPQMWRRRDKDKMARRSSNFVFGLSLYMIPVSFPIISLSMGKETDTNKSRIKNLTQVIPAKCPYSWRINMKCWLTKDKLTPQAENKTQLSGFITSRV